MCASVCTYMHVRAQTLVCIYVCILPRARWDIFGRVAHKVVIFNSSHAQ